MDSENYKKSFEDLKRYKEEESYFHEFISLIRKILYERKTFVKNSDNEALREEFYVFLNEKVREIYQFYKTRDGEKFQLVSDIEFIGCGHTSLVIRIGDCVLKIGKEEGDSARRTYEFPCLIPVFFRKSFKVAEKEYYSLHISPLVDTHSIMEEDVYNSYKSLRDFGYIWNDPKAENIGRITKDMDLGYHYYKKGDLVILDLEDLAFVGEITPDDVLDEISMTAYNGNTYIFEERYMDEKGKSMK